MMLGRGAAKSDGPRLSSASSVRMADRCRKVAVAMKGREALAGDEDALGAVRLGWVAGDIKYLRSEGMWVRGDFEDGTGSEGAAVSGPWLSRGIG